MIECVPNFSEGRDMELIRQITEVIESVEGVRLLDVDPGKATNRTVVTFVGEPGLVVEAAYRAIVKAAELIDMSKHHGEHPRMGATDVCPLIPVSGISMEETAAWSRKLGERVGKAGIPVYLYEAAATTPERVNLASIRAGEYEGLANKIRLPEWKPDYGEALFNARSGATVIGARDFLVAYNINLNTTSTRRANAVAFDVREAGRKVKDEQGKETVQPGTLKSVKAIGWYIEEYGMAQISMNLTNIRVTPMHVAFEEVCRKAEARGIRVTGSELVGLIPLQSMLDAGRYFLEKQQRSPGVSEEELIRIAVMSLGLQELGPFDPEKKIIEYLLKDPKDSRLTEMSLKAFADETASESPAPGGGSIAAYAGALGASLGAMVANLSAHKRGWDDRWQFFGDWAVKGQHLKEELLGLVNEDTRAFNGIMDAFGLPKSTPAEKAARTEAIQQATLYATKVPLRTMETAFRVFELIRAMVKDGNPNSLSDAGVGALCARAAVLGAWMNVKINAAGLKSDAERTPLLEKAESLRLAAIGEESEILKIITGML